MPQRTGYDRSSTKKLLQPSVSFTIQIPYELYLNLIKHKPERESRSSYILQMILKGFAQSVRDNHPEVTP